MQSYIQNYLSKFSVDTKEVEQQVKKKEYASERAEIVSKIYPHYLYWNKDSNIKTFLEIYKDTAKIKNKKLQEDFKQSKKYYPPMEVKLYCIKIAHIPTKDLYYILSIANDMKNRKQNFNKWLFSQIKIK